MSHLIIACNKVLVRDDDNDDEINGHIDYNNHNDDDDNGPAGNGQTGWNVHCENNEYNVDNNEDDNDDNDHNGDEHNDDDDDQGAGGNGQAGRNVPREPAPIITSLVNPRPPLHLLRSDYIDHLYDDFHCSDDDDI